MQIYECILSLISGIGVFLTAIKILSESLNQIAGNSMKKLLEKIAGNKIKGVLIGALVTAVIQSSSATTVMVIGFVNADVMDLTQATAIIIGSNIGTTITGIIASLESFNISLYLSLFSFIGVMFTFLEKLKKFGYLLIGLGMIFIGLKIMSNACDDESIRSYFTEILEKLNSPLILEFLGVIFTSIIQSSSAMTGIVIVMVGKKVMPLRNGLFITLGANVGTCITALIGIIGANINSKRTALVHFIFNVSGCVLFTPILCIFDEYIAFILEKISSENSIRIAYFHLFFNISTACIMIPLINHLVRFVKYVIKDKEGLYKINSSSSYIDISISNDINTEDLHNNENVNDNEKFINSLKNEKQVKKELKTSNINNLNEKENSELISIKEIKENKNANKKIKRDSNKNIVEEEKEKLNV